MKTLTISLLLAFTLTGSLQAQDRIPTQIDSCGAAASGMQSLSADLGRTMNMIGYDLQAMDWYVQYAFYLYSAGDTTGAYMVLQEALWSLWWADNQIVYAAQGMQEVYVVVGYAQAAGCDVSGYGAIMGQLEAAANALSSAWQSLQDIGRLFS